MKLEGKVAIVTGASKGIGSAIAKIFLENGAIVIINNKTETDYSKKNLEELKKIGDVHSIIGDVSCEDFVCDFVKEVKAKFGRIDILVNNCGIAHFSMLVDTTNDNYEDVMGINFKSTYMMSREVLKTMMYSGGNILNISSMWGLDGASCEVLYSASKSAVIGFTKALSKEVAQMGVRVNCIAPGAIDTDMNSKFDSDEKREIEDMFSMNRFGTKEEVAKAALFLSTDDSSYITGTVLSVDGGKI